MIIIPEHGAPIYHIIVYHTIFGHRSSEKAAFLQVTYIPTLNLPHNYTSPKTTQIYRNSQV